MAVQVSQAMRDEITQQRDSALATASAESDQAQQATVRRDRATQRAAELDAILANLTVA